MAENILKIDASSLGDLAQKLGQLSGAAMNQAIAAAINTVAESGYDLARARMNAGINVTDQYMREKMGVDHATQNSARATITAVGDLTGLSHYNPVQMAPVSGQRGRGVSVTVTRGQTKTVQSKRVFVIPSIRDTEGNPLVFRRLAGKTSGGKSRLQRVLGPSVYQLFAHQLPTLIPDVEEALGNELLNVVEQEILKALP